MPDPKSASSARSQISFKVIIEKVNPDANFLKLCQRLSSLFAIDPETMPKIIELAPIAVAENLPKIVIKNIKPALVELSKEGITFRVTARNVNDVPSLIWPDGAKFFTNESGRLYRVFNINWKSSAIRCPHCSKPIIFKPLRVFTPDKPSTSASGVSKPTLAPSTRKKSEGAAVAKASAENIPASAVSVKSAREEVDRKISASSEELISAEDAALAALINDPTEPSADAQTAGQQYDEIIDEDGNLISMDAEIKVDKRHLETAGQSPYLIAQEKGMNPFEEKDPNETEHETMKSVADNEENDDKELLEVDDSDEDADEDDVEDEDEGASDEDDSEDEGEEEKPSRGKRPFTRGKSSLKFKGKRTAGARPSSRKISGITSNGRRSSGRGSVDKNLFDVVLTEIKSPKIREKAADIISEIADISYEEADELACRKTIPAISGVTDKDAKKYLKMFKAIKVKGKIVPAKV